MLATSFLAATLLTSAQANAPVAEYHIDIRPQQGASPEVFITLQVAGDSDGQTLLKLPSSWGGEQELWRGFKTIAVAGGKLQPVDPEVPTERVINHEPNAELTIRWQIIQDREGAPTAAADDNYRPWLQPRYVHLLGYTIFLSPERDSHPLSGDTPVRVSFNAEGDWALASDLEGETLTYGSLGESVIVAGDFRISEHIIGGAPVRVAVRGDMNDQQIISVAESSIAGTLAYWDDTGEPFLVTALPIEVEPGRSSFGGTNLRDAFAIFGTNNVPDEIIARVLLHEYSHSWVPGRLGSLTQGPEQPQDYWFSEGVNDFVTTRAGLLSGAWDAAAAITQLNEFLDEYMASSAREEPNTAIRDGFWRSRELQRLPYLRGNLFALLIDQLIFSETNGAQDLDDVLLAMRHAPEQGLVAHTFVDFVRDVTGVDITELHQRHIIDGETIILPADTFGNCGVVEGDETQMVQRIVPAAADLMSNGCLERLAGRAL